MKSIESNKSGHIKNIWQPWKNPLRGAERKPAPLPEASQKEIRQNSSSPPPSSSSSPSSPQPIWKRISGQEGGGELLLKARQRCKDWRVISFQLHWKCNRTDGGVMRCTCRWPIALLRFKRRWYESSRRPLNNAWRSSFVSGGLSLPPPPPASFSPCWTGAVVDLLLPAVRIPWIILRNPQLTLQGFIWVGWKGEKEEERRRELCCAMERMPPGGFAGLRVTSISSAPPPLPPPSLLPP